MVTLEGRRRQTVSDPVPNMGRPSEGESGTLGQEGIKPESESQCTCGLASSGERAAVSSWRRPFLSCGSVSLGELVLLVSQNFTLEEIGYW
jgi:hypothetical protein